MSRCEKVIVSHKNGVEYDCGYAGGRCEGCGGNKWEQKALEKKLIEAYNIDPGFAVIIDRYLRSSKTSNLKELIEEKPLEILSEVYSVKQKEIDILKEELHGTIARGGPAPVIIKGDKYQKIKED